MVEGGIVAVTDGVQLEIELDPSYRHSFAGVEFYSDAEGTTPVTPSGGTVTFELKTPLQPNAFQSFTLNAISAASADQVNWGTNALAVRATLSSVVGAAYARLRATMNIS